MHNDSNYRFSITGSKELLFNTKLEVIIKNIIENIKLTEISLFQVILYMLLWISDEYIASLVTIIMVPILIGILIVSVISELIERSKVPKKYFHFLIVSIIIPIIIGLFFLTIYEGQLDWLEKI